MIIQTYKHAPTHAHKLVHTHPYLTLMSVSVVIVRMFTGHLQSDVKAQEVFNIVRQFFVARTHTHTHTHAYIQNTQSHTNTYTNTRTQSPHAVIIYTITHDIILFIIHTHTHIFIHTHSHAYTQRRYSYYIHTYM